MTKYFGILDVDSSYGIEYTPYGGITLNFLREYHVEKLKNDVVLCWGQSIAKEWQYVVTDGDEGKCNIIAKSSTFTKNNIFIKVLEKARNFEFEYDMSDVEILNSLRESKKENKTMKKSLTEKRISTEDKIQALADYKGVEIDEVEEGYDENHFEVDGEEWMVLTEDESYEEFKNWEMGLIDDLGLESFSEDFQEHILKTCIDESWFEQIAEEEADYYISEMSDEELLDYAHDHRLAKKVDSVDDEDFDRSDIEDECKYEYQDEIESQGISEYFENIYGRNWTKEMKDTLKKEIDWDKVIDELYKWDTKNTLHGFMASYDGQEHEFGKYNGEWIFGYRTN